MSAPVTSRAKPTSTAWPRKWRPLAAQILVLNTPRPPSPMRDFLEEQDQARWDQGYQQQLHGALLVLRKIPPLIAKTGWGRVVAITSATIKQPLPRHAISGSFHNVEQRVAAVPLKRAGMPEELAATVAFLVSEHAGFITGENIQLDGGQTRSLV
jgi:3-oxoacyl-[acyl-carrier protein] reductase